MKTTTIRAAFAAAITIAADVILPSFADRTLNDGLVAYLPFDNSMTENAVAGSPVAPEASTATAPALANAGMVGKCLNIPSGAYVKLTGSDSVTLANSSLGFEDSNRSFTAMIWVKYGNQSGDPSIFGNKTWSGGAKGVIIAGQDKSTKVKCNVGNGSARKDVYFTGEGSGVWTFYAMVGNNGSFTVYHGKSDGTISSQTMSIANFTMASTYPFYIGQDGTGNYSSKFVGQVDDFALWNRALSEADIRRIHTSGRAGKKLADLLQKINDGLAVYMPFDESTSDNVVVGSTVTPEASTATPPTLENDGVIGKCLNLPNSGNGAFVKLTGTDTGSLAFDNGNRDFTAVIWANYGKQTSDPAILANKNWTGGGSLKGIVFFAEGNTQNAKLNAGSGSARLDTNSLAGEGSGKWTFYAVTCRGENFTVYQGKSNGTFNSVTGSRSGFSLESGEPFYIGQDGEGDYPRKFVGKFDDFALWTRTLQIGDIARIYQYGHSGASIGDLLQAVTNSSVSTVFVASNLEGAEGTEPNGFYLVDGSRTFTAPASVTVGGHNYAPLGYTLEIFNLETGVWELDGQGVHPGASYTHTSSADDIDTRITWQWVDSDVPAIAVWTGGANNNDLTDSGNWSCTNALGAALSGAVPDGNTTKYILAADADWSAATFTLAAGVAFDLNGHKLYAPGSFASSGLVGTVDYVKNGSFEENNNMSSSYMYNAVAAGWTGGRGVEKGNTFKAVSAPNGSAVWFFQSTSQVSTTITIPESGYYTISFYYGGRSGHTGGVIHLDVDAVQDCTNVTCSATSSTQASVTNMFLTKGDHTMTFRHTYTSGDICSWIDAVSVKRETAVFDSSSDAANPGELHIAVPADTTLDDYAYLMYGNMRVVKEGAGTLSVPTSRWYFIGGIDVQAGTLSMPGPVAFVEGGSLGDIKVASGAKVTIPATDGLRYGEVFTLDGGTLELALSGTVAPVTTYITNSLTLNAGAKLFFDMTALDTTEFILSTDGFTLGEGVESAVSCAEVSRQTEAMAEASGANGIRIAVLTEAATAIYTGAGADPLDFTDAANWACTNAIGGGLPGKIPLGVTEVTISGTTAFQVTNGAPFVCASVTFDNATLPDNADLRGLDFSKVTSDSVIDLQGRTLFLADETSAALSEFTITDTSLGTPGTVHVSVADGSTLLNSGVALTENLRLVKEGGGLFSAGKASQTYTGGTGVSNGTIRVASSGTGHFGSGVVYLPTGSTLDIYNNDASSATVVLAGGTIQNSATTAGTLPRVLSLTSDSTIKHANGSASNNDMNVPAGCEWNLGGYTLSLEMTGNDSDFSFSDAALNVVSNGTIIVTVNTTGGVTKGYFQLRRLSGKDGLRLDLGKTYPRIKGSYDCSVMDFTDNPVSGAGEYNEKGKTIEIYGKFLPKSTLGVNKKMMNGSTLDLTMVTGAFSCNFVKGTNGTGNQKLTFAANSTITVNLDGRTDLKTIAKSESPYIVTWSTKPADTTTFVLDETTRQHFKCEVTDAGLRLKKINGLVIIVK